MAFQKKPKKYLPKMDRELKIEEQIHRLRVTLEAAILSGNVAKLEQQSQKCDQVLRSILPLTQMPASKDHLIKEMESLLMVYNSAIKMVQALKTDLVGQIHQLRKTTNQTKKYLAVASQSEQSDEGFSQTYSKKDNG